MDNQILTPAQLRELAARIDKKVERISKHAHQMAKEENPTTSNIAQAVKDIAEQYAEEQGVSLEVYVEEFPLTQEAKSGADLYISIVIGDGRERISKGMLVQAKRLEKLKRKDERRRLRNQSNRMRNRMVDDSYVLGIDENGARCIKAPKSSDPKLWDYPVNSFGMGELIADGIACERGDRRQGIPANSNVPEALRSKMRALSVPYGVAMIVHGT
jgi:hypothetical protein